MSQTLLLPPQALAILILAVFIAGIIRGFTGFAASATIMAVGTLVLVPIELLPICLLFELTASAFLVRGSIREADFKLTIPLVGFAFAALPVGLFLVKRMDADLSSLIVLFLVASLSALQLARVPLPLGRGWFSSALVGATAGFVHGLANVGGLIQALYIMALNLSPKVMRATMILGILISGGMGLFWQTAMGILNWQALLRACVLMLPFLIGLWIGKRNFTPENERFYRPISLSVLIALAAVGIIRRLI